MEYSAFAQRLQPSAIRTVSKAIHGKKVISFAGGMPHPSTFPHVEIAALAEEVLQTRAPEALQYGQTQGYQPLLETVAGYLRGRGLPGITAENILIAAGSQQALDLVGRILIDPGDLVLMESPGYPGASAAFTNLGARVEGIPVLADGPDLDALEQAVCRDRPKFFYTTPNFANPAGVLVSQEKRRKIAEMAERYGFWVVEDDAYGEILFAEASPADIVPLKAFDQSGCTIYMQTFSKTISPGLRVAAIAAPAAAVNLLEMTKQAADMFTSTFTQILVNEFIVRGHFAARLPALRSLYQSRRDAMDQALREHFPEARWVTPKGGFFFWLEMPEGIDTQALLAPALEAGVAFMPGACFFVGSGVGRSADSAQMARTMRLAYSRESEGDIARGLAQLGQLAQCQLSPQSMGSVEMSNVG
jgi:2-aminoadipate transaminase